MKKLIVIIAVLTIFISSAHSYDSAYSGANVDQAVNRANNPQTTVGDPGSDSNLASEQAIREALNAKEDATSNDFDPDRLAGDTTDNNLVDDAIIDSDIARDSEVAAAYQPLEATLTDIADGTIAEDLVNTAFPWADNEVADDITASNYLPLAGGVLTGEVTVDNLGLEFTAGDDHTDCTAFSATGGGIFYDDSEGKFKKCQDNVLTDLDTGGGGGLSNVVEDVTPQLGGNLDIQAFSIEGVDATEFGYIDGVTSDIQTQLNAKEGTLTNEAGLYAALSDVSQFLEPGDAIDSSVIGGVTPAAGTFTTLTADTISAGAAGFTVDADGDVVVKTLTTTGESGTAGALRAYEDPAYQTHYRGWLAQDNFTQSLDFRFPDGEPSANQFFVMGTPSVSISDMSYAGFDSTYFDTSTITSIDTQFKGVVAGTTHTSLTASQVMVDTDGISDLTYDLLVYSDGATDYIVLAMAEADIPSTGEDDYVVSYDATNKKWYMAAGGGGGSVAWDDITAPDANDEIDFGAYIIELNVADLRIGDGGANYIGIDGSAVMTFNGTADIILPTDSVDSANYVDDSIDDAHLNFGSGANQIDYSDITTGNISTSGTAATGVLTVTGVINTSVGIDAVGAADLDYGSADVTDHTFISDGGTVVIDGSINIPASTNYQIGGANIIADSAGTATLSNIDALDATTEATVEAAIDTLANLTSAAALATVGTITSGTWQGTAIAAGYYAAASIDGDDLNSNIGGRSITLTAASPDTIDADSELYTDTKCIYIEDPVDTDDLQSIWTANGFAATLTKIWCESDQTVNMDLQVDDGTPADVDGTDLVCDATPAEDEALAGDATMADGDRLDLAITSVSGTPTWVSICWTYTKDD